jgi:hypothetical protein
MKKLIAVVMLLSVILLIVSGCAGRRGFAPGQLKKQGAPGQMKKH